MGQKSIFEHEEAFGSLYFVGSGIKIPRRCSVVFPSPLGLAESVVFLETTGPSVHTVVRRKQVIMIFSPDMASTVLGSPAISATVSLWSGVVEVSEIKMAAIVTAACSPPTITGGQELLVALGVNITDGVGGRLPGALTSLGAPSVASLCDEGEEAALAVVGAHAGVQVKAVALGHAALLHEQPSGGPMTRYALFELRHTLGVQAVLAARTEPG
jgi:hypothetical protein